MIKTNILLSLFLKDSFSFIHNNKYLLKTFLKL